MGKGAAVRFVPVEGTVPASLLETGEGDIADLVLGSDPLITDADIVAYLYDGTPYESHRLRLRPKCVANLPRLPEVQGTPFVVTVHGERIYLGVFLLSFSSHSNSVPTIVVNRYDAGRCPPDWFWIDRNYPHRVAIGRDPRADPRLIDALRSLGKIKDINDPAWTVPLTGTTPADGNSGLMLSLEPELADYLRSHPGWFPSVRGVATRVGDNRPEAQVTAEFDGEFRCRLPLAPGVYKCWLAIDWRNRGGPPNTTFEVCEMTPGTWAEVTIRQLTRYGLGPR